jgi:hypothetical protein
MGMAETRHGRYLRNVGLHKKRSQLAETKGNGVPMLEKAQPSGAGAAHPARSCRWLAERSCVAAIGAFALAQLLGGGGRVALACTPTTARRRRASRTSTSAERLTRRSRR